MNRDSIERIKAPITPEEEAVVWGFYEADLRTFLDDPDKPKVSECFYLDFLRINGRYWLVEKEKEQLLQKLPDELHCSCDSRSLPHKFLQVFYIRMLRRVYHGFGLTLLDNLLLSFSAKDLKGITCGLTRKKFAEHFLYWSIGSISKSTSRIAYALDQVMNPGRHHFYNYVKDNVILSNYPSKLYEDNEQE